MKAKIRTPLVILGQIGRDKFKAEVYPGARLIVCSGEPFGGFLPNDGTEERARIIAKQLLGHWVFVIFRFWFYVEVQTTYREISFTKVTGLTWSGRNDSRSYRSLTPEEAKKVEPFIQSLRKQFEIQKESQKPEWEKNLDALSQNPDPQFVRTPPPNASH